MKNNAILELNYFEFGFLYASIKDDAWDRMPKSLSLKMKITFTKAYINHDTLGKQARKDLKDYEKALKKFEEGKHVKKPK